MPPRNVQPGPDLEGLKPDSALVGRTPDSYWNAKLRALLKSRRISILALARAAHEARSELGTADWITMCGQVGIPRATARLLARIGRELVGFEEQDCARILAQWTALYEVALLGGNAVVRLMAAGVVRPDLSVSREALVASSCSNHPMAKAITQLSLLADEGCSLSSRNRRFAWASSLKDVSRAMLSPRNSTDR